MLLTVPNEKIHCASTENGFLMTMRDTKKTLEGCRGLLFKCKKSGAWKDYDYCCDIKNESGKVIFLGRDMGKL